MWSNRIDKEKCNIEINLLKSFTSLKHARSRVNLQDNKRNGEHDPVSRGRREKNCLLLFTRGNGSARC